MRKWLGPVGVMFLMAGLVVAAEGTISKLDLDKKTVTIKQGDKDNEYKFTDKVKVTVAGGKAKDGKGQAKEGTYADFKKALKVGEKLASEAKHGVLTEVKITGMGKGKEKGERLTRTASATERPALAGHSRFLARLTERGA